MLTRAELEKESIRIIKLLKMTVSLDDLVIKYKKVYFNLDGKDNRMKIMANEHYKENGLVKCNHHQLYRLSMAERKTSTKEDLVQRFVEIKKLCFSIKQLKMLDEILDTNSRILLANEISEDVSLEIDKFFIRNNNKRK